MMLTARYDRAKAAIDLSSHEGARREIGKRGGPCAAGAQGPEETRLSRRLQMVMHEIV
jgi:hypothetical protein